MLKNIGAALCASAFVLAYSGPSFGETLTGVVQKIQVTLKLKDGKTRVLEVNDDVNLDHVDVGDQVNVTVANKKISEIRVTKEDIDKPRKKETD